MAPTDRQLPAPVERDEAWKCNACQKLIYNTDKNGAPIPGAPLPKYGGVDHPEVCNVCFAMKSVLENLESHKLRTYWKDLHDKWKNDSKNADKLRPGDDYLAR